MASKADQYMMCLSHWHKEGMPKDDALLSTMSAIWEEMDKIDMRNLQDQLAMVTGPFDEEQFILESNAIEGYEGASFGPGSMHYDDHLIAWELAKERVPACERVDEKLILDIHKCLMIRLLPGADGRFRRVNIHIGNESGSVHRFPAYRKVPKLMSVVYKLAKKAKTVSDCWDVHHAFESVHPFQDGNGRTGRCLLNGMLLRCGHNPIVVSAWKKHAYYRLITLWRQKNMHLLITA